MFFWIRLNHINNKMIENIDTLTLKFFKFAVY